MNTHDPASIHQRFPVQVLVSVDKQLRPRPVEITQESLESEMNAVIPVVDPARGIVLSLMFRGLIRFTLISTPPGA